MYADRLDARTATHLTATAGDGDPPETVPGPKHIEPASVSEGPATPVYTGKEATLCSDTAQGDARNCGRVARHSQKPFRTFPNSC